MRVSITATTCASPSAFAVALRGAILSARSDIDLSIRAVWAPDERRFQVIEVAEEGDFLRELLPIILDALRDELNEDARGLEHG